MNQENEHFEEWAILTLFGTPAIAGHVTERKIAGQDFLQVEVPDETGEIAHTTCIAITNVERITLCDKQAAVAAMANQFGIDCERLEEEDYLEDEEEG